MYTPSPFRNDDVPALHDLIERYSFGTLVTHADGHELITHLPFLIDRDRGALGTLVAHMARANPHWRAFERAAESVAVFMGPHTYISPAWYVNRTTVPTWNYAAVHAVGAPRLVDDPTRLCDMVEALVDFHEAPIGRPWDRTKARDVVARELPGIVGFEIEIARIEGKFKLNQNRSLDDRRSVIRALEGSSSGLSRDVAAIMRESLER